MDLHRRGKEGRIVKRDIALGDGVEDKFQVEGAAIFNHIVDADVTFVMAEAEIDLCGSAGLFGSVAQCVERAGRDAVDLWQIKTLLHNPVRHWYRFRESLRLPEQGRLRSNQASSFVIVLSIDGLQRCLGQRALPNLKRSLILFYTFCNIKSKNELLIFTGAGFPQFQRGNVEK